MAVQPDEPGSHIAAIAGRLRAARIRRAGSCSEPSKFERSMDKGVVGERRLGARLDALAAESVLLVAHSLRRADGGDIDHLVVGPHGVSVIDSKCWSGTVTVGKNTLWQGRHNREKQLKGVRDQVTDVVRLLSDRGMSAVPVEGLLCLVEDNAGLVGSELHPVPGLMVGCLEPVLEHAARPGPMDPSGVRRIYDALLAAFRDDHQPLVPKGWSTPQWGSTRPARRRRGASLGLQLARLVVPLVLTGVVINAGLASMGDQGGSPRLTRAELKSQFSHWRKVAMDRAGGAVHGPRVKSTPGTFYLTFKRQPHCVVRLDVPRVRTEQALIRSENCR